MQIEKKDGDHAHLVYIRSDGEDITTSTNARCDRNKKHHTYPLGYIDTDVTHRIIESALNSFVEDVSSTG